MNRLGLSATGTRSGGLVIGADGSMSAGTALGAALAVAVVSGRDGRSAARHRSSDLERERVGEVG